MRKWIENVPCALTDYPSCLVTWAVLGLIVNACMFLGKCGRYKPAEPFDWNKHNAREIFIKG